jgi:cytochrome c biogenesis protein CcmG/thiol:disulfide interchange protein DsbE
MKTKIFFSLIVFFFLVLFLIFFKGLQNPNVYTPNVNIDKDVPYFQTKLLEKDKMISSDEIFKSNKFYLLNIWSSWCLPCRQEHIFLNNLSNQIEIIGLNYKDTEKNAMKFLKDFNNPYTLNLLDLEGIVAIEWGAYGVPETFLIYNKKIIKKFIGPINNNSLLEIKKMIK